MASAWKNIALFQQWEHDRTWQEELPSRRCAVMMKEMRELNVEQLSQSEIRRLMFKLPSMVTLCQELMSDLDKNVLQGFKTWEDTGGVGVKVRRGPIGIMLGLAPFNMVGKMKVIKDACADGGK